MSQKTECDMLKFLKQPAYKPAQTGPEADAKYKSLRLPIFAEIHTNPYLQKANFLVGISVIAF